MSGNGGWKGDRLVPLIPEREAIQVSLTVDGKPLGELIEDPRDSKPNLANDGHQPERVRLVDRVQNSVAEEETDHHQTNHDDHSVRVDLARWERHFP